LNAKHLHIVCLDVPFPADYGGAIDMFYRIQALHSLGLNLTIHVFEYGRGRQEELEKFGAVNYYKRSKSIFHLFSKRPFIVQSRMSKQLLENLSRDRDPILLEGLHTCGILEDPAIQQRMTFARMHNIEHDYYRGLTMGSTFLKRLFFRLEARKLERYESVLSKAKHVFVIKESDVVHVKQYQENTHFLPASFPPIEGRYGAVHRYALIHGNLSVSENEQAVYWILNTLHKVMDPNFPIVVAGKNPSKRLVVFCEKMNVKVISNPSEKHLDTLIQEAHIHLLHTTVPSGIKLKLLASIHSAGHVLVNSKLVQGSGLIQFCTIADEAKEYRLHFLGLKNHEMTKEAFDQRHAYITTHFNTAANCQIILRLMENSHE
jgi:hypothetical protein